jgi:hypothetical protein
VCLAVGIARHFLKRVIRQLAEIFGRAPVVGLVVELAVVGIRRDEPVVALLGLLTIDRTFAAEAVYAATNSSWHGR